MEDETRMKTMEEAIKKTDLQLGTITTAMAKLSGDHEERRRQITEMRSEMRSGIDELRAMMASLMNKVSAQSRNSAPESMLPNPRESPLLSISGMGKNLSSLNSSSSEGSDRNRRSHSTDFRGEKSIGPFENPNRSGGPVQLNQDSTLSDEPIGVIEETSLEIDKDPKDRHLQFKDKDPEDRHLQFEPSKVIHYPLKMADVGVASKEMGESVEVEVSIEIERVDFWSAYNLFDEMPKRGINVLGYGSWNFDPGSLDSRDFRSKVVVVHRVLDVNGKFEIPSAHKVIDEMPRRNGLVVIGLVVGNLVFDPGGVLTLGLIDEARFWSIIACCYNEEYVRMELSRKPLLVVASGSTREDATMGIECYSCYTCCSLLVGLSYTCPACHDEWGSTVRVAQKRLQWDPGRSC